MRLAAHQPDLLPYPGFFVKMARAHQFDLGIWDQFQKKGYQRRVLMRGEWAGHMLAGARTGVPIAGLRLRPESTDQLLSTVQGRYRGSRNWDKYGDMVVGWIDESRSEALWLQNLSLILSVRAFLRIPVPVSIGSPLTQRGVDGLIELCKQYDDVTEYLSGTGGREYMGENPERAFNQRWLRLVWNEYDSPTTDSILTPIFDEPDPVGWFWKEVAR